LPGHFPGAPIVPGVVILDEVNAALVERCGQFKLTGIPLLKFLAPLKPEQPFTISISDDKVEGEIHFCCRVAERVIAEGKLRIDSTRPLNP
jgi:3-hydroxymyristoyl/3-hydroxydecanoyl-(acyl carrier protein) dehydratase